MGEQMTLFFNWKTVESESKGNPFKAVDILTQLMLNRILKHGLKHRLKGNSFLLNPEPLLADKRTDVLFVYQYIFLASKRDYTFFALFDKRSLPLSYYPEISTIAVRPNPLLTIKNNEIYFKYEE